jgi:hypothetical protein
MNARPGERTMPSHRTPAVLLLPAVLAAACLTGLANAQETVKFVDSGQGLDEASCALSSVPQCGDGACDANETSVTCPEDCAPGCAAGEILDCDGTGACWPEKYLGDGWCDGGAQVYQIDFCCYDNDGGDCTKKECIPVPGACCVADTCQELLVLDCFAAGGHFIGGECSSETCLIECCVDGTCMDLLPSECDTAGGIYAPGAACNEDGYAYSVALGDLDGDGDLDVYLAYVGSQPDAVWINDGNGTFTNSGQALASGSSYSVALGDLDSDGDLDAFVANHFGQPNTVWTNDGTGIFTDSGQELGDKNSTSVALGDLDGDGDIDAYVLNKLNGNGNNVWINDGTGTFTLLDQLISLQYSDETVALGDVDGDGDLDAAYSNGALWLNSGDAHFSSGGSEDGLPQLAASSVALGDLNGDGHLDIMFGDGPFAAGDGASVWFNDGDGIFTDSGQALGGNRKPLQIALDDLDGDGDLDAVFAIGFYTSPTYPNTVWINDGTGLFSPTTEVLGNENSFSVALGDLDGDGDPDAVFANSDPSTVWINDASLVSAVYNKDFGVWYDSVQDAIAEAISSETLLIGGRAFDVPGIIDTQDLPLNFEARCPIEFSEDLMFLPGDGTSFFGMNGNPNNTYTASGRIIGPDDGKLIFNALEFLEESQFQQNGSTLLVNGTVATNGGVTYLSGETLAAEISTGIDGVNRIASDTEFFSDYINAGSTIIQRGILYIYGDLTNTGTMAGDYENGLLDDEGPEEGDGYSVGGAYVIGPAASLVLPESLWRLSVGGNLEIAIDDPARFAMAQSTIELDGLAPGNEQTMETLSADLGADEMGFDPANFPIGTLRIASGSNTILVNKHVNSTDTPCEALYVDTLIVKAGASLTTAGCRIYTRDAFIEGTVDDYQNIIVLTDCPADLDGDGVVNGLDLAILLATWGGPNVIADFNDDGVVDGQDLTVMLAAWGFCAE